jgi:hypothetical protein
MMPLLFDLYFQASEPRHRHYNMLDVARVRKRCLRSVWQHQNWLPALGQTLRRNECSGSAHGKAGDLDTTLSPFTPTTKHVMFCIAQRSTLSKPVRHAT